MKKTFAMIALLASSSLALVSPALAHDQQDNYGYRNQTYSNSYSQTNNRYTTNDNGYRNSNARGNGYVAARGNDWGDREPVRDRQWQRRDLGSREWR